MNCPVCGRPMTKFNDGYRCMNIKAPEHRTPTTGPGRRGGDRGSTGKRYPGRGRKGK